MSPRRSTRASPAKAYGAGGLRNTEEREDLPDRPRKVCWPPSSAARKPPSSLPAPDGGAHLPGQALTLPAPTWSIVASFGTSPESSCRLTTQLLTARSPLRWRPRVPSVGWAPGDVGKPVDGVGEGPGLPDAPAGGSQRRGDPGQSILERSRNVDRGRRSPPARSSSVPLNRPFGGCAGLCRRVG